MYIFILLKKYFISKIFIIFHIFLICIYLQLLSFETNQRIDALNKIIEICENSFYISPIKGNQFIKTIIEASNSSDINVIAISIDAISAVITKLQNPLVDNVFKFNFYQGKFLIEWLFSHMRLYLSVLIDKICIYIDIQLMLLIILMNMVLLKKME